MYSFFFFFFFFFFYKMKSIHVLLYMKLKFAKIDACRFCFFFFSSPESEAHWWAYRIGRPPSSVVHILQTSSPQKPLGQSKSNFIWGGETKVCWHCPGHMTKMVAMSIYGKNLKNLLPCLEPKSQWPRNLVCSIGCSSTTKFVQMMILDWPWPILRQYQIWFLMLLYGKKVKQWILQKLL